MAPTGSESVREPSRMSRANAPRVSTGVPHPDDHVTGVAREPEPFALRCRRHIAADHVHQEG